MSLSLSPADLSRLEATTNVLLSPLATDDPERWRALACDAVARFVGAARAVLVLPAPADGSPVEAEPSAAPVRRVAADGGSAERDGGVRARSNPARRAGCAAERSVEVRRWREDAPCRVAVLDGPGLARDGVDGEGGVPDVASLAVEVYAGEPAATLLCYGPPYPVPGGAERMLALLGLLRPAFRHGVHGYLAAAAHRAAFARLADELSDGMVVADRAGRVLHENAAFRRLVADDPESAKLRAEVAGAVRALTVRAAARSHGSLATASPTSVRHCRTAHGDYRVRAAVTPTAATGPGCGVLVLVERATAAPPSDEALRSVYRLTPREVQVARLISAGARSAEMANTLGVSVHTVRRHTERVFGKLGAHCRAQVGARLLAGCAPQAPATYWR
jgi:DNA-binding CsgD family transcriptional regulator/PAS domain-containing protein